MLKDDLDAMAEAHPDRFSVWYTVDRAPDGWEYSEGFVDSEMIAAHLPSGEGSMIIVCGPPPMIKFACMPAFDKLGVSEETCYIEGGCMPFNYHVIVTVLGSHQHWLHLV